MLTRYDLLAIFIVTLMVGVFIVSKASLGQETNMEPKNMKTAIFAAGCFWCIEKEMESVDGVHDAVSGYTGGDTVNPTYEDVSTGKTGHKEAVQIIYDPEVVTYKELLDVFWKNVDPLNSKGQFCDVGTQYTSAIFYQNEQEKELAEKSKLVKEGMIKQSIITEILPAKTFYKAEEYHQQYYQKNPFRYKIYRNNCGRDERLKDVWE